MATVMGDWLLNPVGENTSKNHPPEGRKEKHLSMSYSLHWSRMAHIMLNPLLLDCDVMKKGVGWGEFGGQGRGKSSPVIKNQVFEEVAGM